MSVSELPAVPKRARTVGTSAETAAYPRLVAIHRNSTGQSPRQGDEPVRRADQVIEVYMGTLPADFKGRFASMRDLYGELSGDLHSATGSSELFDKAKGQIAEHFETRRVFKLRDRPEPAADPRVGA